MTTTSLPGGRRARGRQTEILAAAFLRAKFRRLVPQHWDLLDFAKGLTSAIPVCLADECLYAFAQPTGSSTPGVDILNTPGSRWEIKARRKFDPMVWLKQVRTYTDTDEVPVVMWRPDGSGPETVADWPVMTTARHMRALLADRQALLDIAGPAPLEAA
jgi:hypothetical protein